MKNYSSYKEINRIKLNNLYDQLERIRKEIREAHHSPDSASKNWKLEDLNQRENFIITKIAELKNILKPSKN